MTPRPSPLTHPRGRLPARVYWVRRGVLAGVALLLVVGLAQLFGGGGGKAAQNTAQLTGRTTTPSASTQPSTNAPATNAANPSAQPDGPCQASDLTVTASVGQPSTKSTKKGSKATSSTVSSPDSSAAGSPVPMQLQISASRPACTFTVSAGTLALAITDGTNTLWTSQDCPAVVPTQKIVAREALPVTVPVTWAGRQSNNGDCSDAQPWVGTGQYHLLAAIKGSTQSDTVFSLTRPQAPVITVHPKPTKKPTPSNSPSATPTTGTKGTKSSGSSKNGGVGGKGTQCGGDNATC